MRIIVMRQCKYTLGSLALKAKKSLAALALLAVATPSLAAYDLSNDTLVVSVSVAPPFVSITVDFHQPEGIDIALIKELQKRTGFKTMSDEMSLMTFNDMIESGRSGHSDIIAGAISATQERRMSYSVTEPYVYNSVCIVTRKGDNIDSLDDLNGRTFAYQTGTNIAALQSSNTNMKLYETSSTFMTFYAVARGKADALLVDEIIAREYIAKWPDANLQVAGKIPGSETGIALFFKKDSPRSKILQKVYQEMIDDGTVDNIVKEGLSQYFADLVY